MIFVHAICDLWIAVGICVGMFLPREAQDYACVILSYRRQSVRLLPCPNFEPRPLAPQVDAAGSFDDIGNVCAANARRDFEEIKFAVGVGSKKLAMRYAAHSAEPFDHMAVGGEQRIRVVGIVWQRDRGEDA